MFFSVSRDLLFGEGISGPAIHRIETRNVLVPKGSQSNH
jgi:hypothetical protein